MLNLESEKQRFLEELATLVDKEKISAWMNRQNDAFDGLTPNQVIEIGRIDKLWVMIYDMRDGMSS